MATEKDDTQEFDLASAQIARHMGVVTPPVHVDFGAATHPGLTRSNNEDHYLVVRRHREREVLLTNLPREAFPQHQDSVYALAVADGVGGAAFGELASQLAITTGWEITGKAFKWGFSLTESEQKELIEGLSMFVQLIHRRIKAEANEVYKGMGTTLTGALTVGHDAFIAHVGDSRAYLYHNGQLTRLTEDMTLAQLMVNVGMIPSMDQAAQRFRNTLVSCLGGNYPEVTIETQHIVLQEGDQLLICTDGLTDMVDESKIAALLGQAGSRQSVCDELIQEALRGGGRDNVTVVLGKYSFPDADPVA